ncbi:MAG: hypothetical protein JRN68_02235 [Nitrososphaerota archaeon]|nr:hypothetical protein [Nitrososphaerota archaeon]
MLVLAASAATVAFAISYRARPRAIATSVSTTTTTSFPASGSDATFIDPVRNAPEINAEAIPTVHTAVTDVQPAYAPSVETTFSASEPIVSETTGNDATTQTVAVAVRADGNTSTMPRDSVTRTGKRSTRTHSSQGRRVKRRAGQQ